MDDEHLPGSSRAPVGSTSGELIVVVDDRPRVLQLIETRVGIAKDRHLDGDAVLVRELRRLEHQLRPLFGFFAAPDIKDSTVNIANVGQGGTAAGGAGAATDCARG